MRSDFFGAPKSLPINPLTFAGTARKPTSEIGFHSHIGGCLRGRVTRVATRLLSQSTELDSRERDDAVVKDTKVRADHGSGP